jgi:glycosyltransferase involved in cell wall biosynthesis
MPLISVITPASRGVKELTRLVRDFKNQTLPKEYWEHIIVYDGTPPADVLSFIEAHKNDYNLKFVSIDKDMGNIKIAPGTRPRNYGTSIATGTYCYYFDDDDRAFDKLMETLLDGMTENSVSVVQMSCQESRIYRDGDPKRIVFLPETGLMQFPQICHVGTPCFMVPTKWAKENPWQHVSEHDFHFINTIVQRYKPQVLIHPVCCVDVDSLMIGTLKDWVSIPPFYRG